MTSTLDSPRVRDLLDRLFADARATDAPMRAELMRLSPEDRAAFLSRARDYYRGFYGAARGLFLPVSPETGRLLYALGRASRARHVVEFGTSFGLSTICLAAALRDNGGGQLIGTELEPSKAARARENLAAAGLDDLVEVREGDALASLARDLPSTVDLVLLDGAKVLYPLVLDILEPHLRAGSVLVADNADDSPDYVTRVRTSGIYVSSPFGPDVEVSVRT